MKKIIDMMNILRKILKLSWNVNRKNKNTRWLKKRNGKKEKRKKEATQKKMMKCFD